MREDFFQTRNLLLFVCIASSAFFLFIAGKEIKINENIREALKKITVNDKRGEPYKLPKEDMTCLISNLFKKETTSRCKQRGILKSVRSAVAKAMADATPFIPASLMLGIQAKRKKVSYVSTFSRVPKRVAAHICKEYFKCKVACKNKSGVLRKFGWCTCVKARACTRLYAILHMLNIISCKDKQKELVYVSFGSGRLLQDYLTIKGLIKVGFKKIHINLIDIGYGNKEGLGIDCFFNTHYKLKEDKTESGVRKEKEALRSFCEVMRKYKNIIAINSYTTYFDFLKKWDKKSVDILLLVDPATIAAELLAAKNPKYANHIQIKNCNSASRGDIVRDIICLLPYRGKPKIFYKGSLEGDIKAYLASGINLYENYKDRKNFVCFLKLFFPDKKTAGDFKIKTNISQSQSQRYSFYELIKSTKSKKALIYQVDKNKIFKGPLNLLVDEYAQMGYKILK
ncbi:hypothetical protein ACFLYU_03805 [Candidatus Dependentiae bacterium]